MNNQFYINKVKEDGTKLEIRVLCMDKELRIDDVGVIPKGKRKITYLGSRISDNYSYRALNHEDRLKFKMEKFKEVCGVKLLNDALEEAWQQMKPELITE